jgi:hypothetical protein
VDHPLKEPIKVVLKANFLPTMKEFAETKIKRKGVTPQLEEAVIKFKAEFPENYATYRGCLKILVFNKPDFKFRPPANMAIYAKIDKTAKVVDIGSGNQKRLVRCGLQITPTEKDPGTIPKVKESPHPENIKWVKELSSSHDVTTSFNVLTQDPDIDEDADGLHVFPDLTSVPRTPEDKVVLTGVKTFDHYLTKTTFKKEKKKRTFRMGNALKDHHSVIPRVGKKFQQLPSKAHAITSKFDGTCAVWNNRTSDSGLWLESGELIQIEHKPGDFVIQLELFEGFAVVTALLKVGFMRPFNSPDNIAQFLEQKNFSLYNNAGEEFILYPPFLCDNPALTDGLVYHCADEQFLCSDTPTFDLKSCDVDKLEDYLLSKGVPCEINVAEGTWEYEIIGLSNGQGHKIVPKKRRADVKKSNEFSTLCWNLDRHQRLNEARKTLLLEKPGSKSDDRMDRYLKTMFEINFT